MATTWSPRTTLFDERRSWLLANGEIVQEPLLEETSTGLKVRVAGTNQSRYSRDTDDLIRETIRTLAARKRTHVWMPLANMRRSIINNIGFDPDQAPAPELHILKADTNVTNRTTVWWRFKHSTLPIEAVLVIDAGPTNKWSQAQQVARSLTLPHMVADDVNMLTQVVKETSHNFAATQNAHYSVTPDQRVTVREFIRDNPVQWTKILGSDGFTDERAMVQTMLTRIREADDLTSIQVPDLRDPSKPAWLDLDLDATNLNSTLSQDLQEYLEGAPSVTEALRLYQELRQALRAIGVVMFDVTENDFQRALLNGDHSGLTVGLSTPNEVGGELDHNHTLTMHLVSGTFIVNCAIAQQDGIADRWDEALTMASLTGEEDVLLAYARESVRRDSEKRATKIIKERKPRDK